MEIERISSGYTDNEWKEAAQNHQQHFATMFEDVVDSIPFDAEVHLLNKLGFAMFGPPQDQPSERNESIGYNLKDRKKIRIVFEKIKESCKSLHEFLISTIFVCLKVDQGKNKYGLMTRPVFKVPRNCDIRYGNSSNIYDWDYIDENGRVYENWQDYLRNNELPSCYYCYPINGEYVLENGNVKLEYKQTPNGSVLKKVLIGTDIASAAVGISSGIVCAVGLAVPIVAPVALASFIGLQATSVYSAARGIGNIVDRALHKQSISLKNSQARSAWLSTVGSVLGGASGLAAKSVSVAAANGELIGTIGKAAVNAVTFSSITVNGIGIFHGGFQIFEKYTDKELTGLDIFQFSVSVLFFCNSIVSAKTAEIIIRDSQSKVLTDYESPLCRALGKMVKSTTFENTSTETNAKVIRLLNTIENPDEFSSAWGRLWKDFPTNNVKTSITGRGGFEISNILEVPLMKLYELSRADKFSLFSFTNKFSEGGIGSDSYVSRVISLLTKYDNITCNNIGNTSLFRTMENQNACRETLLRLSRIAKTVLIVDKLLINTLTEYIFDKLNVSAQLRKKISAIKVVFKCICDLVIDLEDVCNNTEDILRYSSKLTCRLIYIWRNKDCFTNFYTKICNYIKEENSVPRM